VRLFEWRGCPTPEDYADETINRCAKKIADGEEIRDVATYCIGIARMLVFEMGRDRNKEARPLDQAPEPRLRLRILKTIRNAVSNASGNVWRSSRPQIVS
jgi:hypothetical protein